MIATELQDVMFGTPTPIFSEANLGVLEANQVNVIVHGHEPLLSEMIVAAANDPELVELAKKQGATGINVAGICCTGNEVLMRHGVPVAGNFLQQELADRYRRCGCHDCGCAVCHASAWRALWLLPYQVHLHISQGQVPWRYAYGVP